MAVLGTSSVTPAFPTIVRELGVSSGQVELLITAFTLPGIVMTPILGVLSDRYRRKKILVPALLLFGLAGGACAFARGFDLLLALRFCQGIGAAALGTLNVTVIGDIYGCRERSAALGYNSSVLSVDTASYPAIGGLLATFGWFYPFALPFIATPVALVVLFSLHNPEPRNDQRLKDYFGSVWEHLRDREVFGLLGASLLTFIVRFGRQLSYLTILMNERFDAPSYLISAVLSGASLTTALTSTQLDRLTGRFSEKSLLIGSLRRLRSSTLAGRRQAEPATATDPGGPLRRGAGHKPPQRLLAPQRSRPPRTEEPLWSPTVCPCAPARP